MDCESITSFLNQTEIQIARLNLQDPDFIPLHYLVACDIMKELKQFREEIIPNYSECKTITFREIINKYDDLNHTLTLKYDSLFLLNKKVYLIFYENARFEYQLNNEDDGKYLLDRSLQYNPTFPNAILLKLNKLLEKNQFQECLSVLNTLYYETEMDDEQEKQAIVFTDNFYDKLYKTGDSLLKMEHAAEALQLFEILEIFCLNLPTAYCNADYYHGMLNSKTGIYDSYLAIAKVAEKRGNNQIAAHFYQYAQEYLDNNPHLKNYERREEKSIEHREKEEVIAVFENISYLSSKTDSVFQYIPYVIPIISEDIDIIEKDTTREIITETITQLPPLSPVELKEKYDQIVFQALALCIKEDFSASYKMFIEAKKLEDCDCFDTDFRVGLMINELSKILPEPY